MGALDLEICYDFELFVTEYDRHPRRGETGILASIVQVDQRDLLKHPVSETFLHLKWLLVKHYFGAYLLFYIIFLLSITSLVLMNFSPTPMEAKIEQDTINVITDVSLVITFISLILLCVKTIFLVLYNIKLYIATWQNFVELMLLIVCGAFVIVYQFNLHESISVHLAACSVFITWFNFTLLLGKLPAGGIYINMIVGISKDFVKFLTLYTSTLVAFGLCFHVISNHNEHFKDPLSSVLCTLAMMVGEIGFAELFTSSNIKYHWTTQIMFVLFLLLVSIIIMNLLVGLAISNITKQFQTAGVYRLKMTVLLIRMIEDVLRVFRQIFPFCLRNSQLFPYLR